MNWPKKLLACAVYSGLLLVCSTAVSTLLNAIVGGPPGNIRTNMSFLEHWGRSAFLVGWVLLELWYVFLFFGCWVAFFPPRRQWAWLAFSLAAVAAGLLASRDFQQLGTWDYELVDHNIVSPVPESAAIYSNVLACVTAVFSTTLCCLAVRPWFHRATS